METAILTLKNVNKNFILSKKRIIQAVNNVSLQICDGETFGLVGESGCGKTTLGRIIKGIYRATSGEIIYDGNNIINLNKKEKKQYMRDMQMIFQDPYSSLNPRMTVKDIIAEGLNIHNIGTKEEREEKVYDLLGLVGLNREFISRFPHEFSGGQRQRLVIARALAVNPKFIICDEPISALDVSVQAQIVNLLQDLQSKFNLTYLFIAHDLSMVKHISDKVGVMYMGKIIELASKSELFNNPQHPYTKALLASIPVPDPIIEREKKQITIEGELPSLLSKIEGCKFKTRCPYVTKKCDYLKDELKDIGNKHFIMCTLFEK